MVGSDREYKIRYINEEDCNSFHVDKFTEWPNLRLPSSKESDEGKADEEECEDYPVLGAIWNTSGKLVAAWVFHDDEHVELFGKKDFPFIDDLRTITYDLCKTICPDMGGVMDDGSGIERKVTKILDTLLDCEALDSLYSMPEREESEKEK